MICVWNIWVYLPGPNREDATSRTQSERSTHRVLWNNRIRRQKCSSKARHQSVCVNNRVEESIVNGVYRYWPIESNPTHLLSLGCRSRSFNRTIYPCTDQYGFNMQSSGHYVLPFAMIFTEVTEDTYVMTNNVLKNADESIGIHTYLYISRFDFFILSHTGYR